jgi:hypothetical protein
MSIIKVTHQGAPIVNVDIIREKRLDDVALLIIDMASKNCEILGHGSHNDILIVPTEYSTNLDKDAIDNSEATSLRITGYEEWHLFLVDISRYTLRVCLTKGDWPRS